MERTLPVLVALLALAGAFDDDMAELAQVLRESCSGETGVDVALVEAINKGATLTPDPKLKCYIKCVMETAGMMAEGEMDVEAVLAVLPDELRAKTEAGLRACGTKRGADHCDTAYLTQVCWQNSNPAAYFLI